VASERDCRIAYSNKRSISHNIFKTLSYPTGSQVVFQESFQNFLSRQTIQTAGFLLFSNFFARS
jgi:hypothetical protein